MANSLSENAYSAYCENFLYDEPNDIYTCKICREKYEREEDYMFDESDDYYICGKCQVEFNINLRTSS